MVPARDFEVTSVESKRPATVRLALVRYAMAAVAVLVACGLCFLLVPLVGYRVPLVLFVGASLIAAWYGGWRAGLAAMIASFLLSDYFFIPPVFHFGFYSLIDGALLLIYGSVTAIDLLTIS